MFDSEYEYVVLWAINWAKNWRESDRGSFCQGAKKRVYICENAQKERGKGAT